MLLSGPAAGAGRARARESDGAWDHGSQHDDSSFCVFEHVIGGPGVVVRSRQLGQAGARARMRAMVRGTTADNTMRPGPGGWCAGG